MTLLIKTEIDILKESVRKATIIPVEDPLEALDAVSVAESTANRRDLNKVAIKIWTAVGKFIRSQCNKGRVIDTNSFGTFCKGSTLDATRIGADEYYVYCPGPNSAFTNADNAQNVPDISQSILEEKLVQLNYNSIAAVSRCTPESVKSLLQTMKADVVDFVHVKNMMLNLNCMVGQLSFTAQGSVEFKSAQALETVSNFSSILPFDMRSKAGGADRGIISMQSEQQSTSGRSCNLTNSAQKRKLAAQTFNSKPARTWAKDPNTLLSTSQEQTGDEFGHLTQFLQDQIISRKKRSTTDGTSRGSRRSVANNAIIEQAAKIKSDEVAVKELRDTNKAGQSVEKVPTKKDWQTMHLTHIHKPMYTSPGMEHSRHKTVDMNNRTPIIGVPKQMAGTVDMNLDHNRDFMSNDRALYRHSDKNLNNIISRSLNRKNVSYAYHTGYPLMMNAQGPYAIYSHHKNKGEQNYLGERKTRKAAYNRFEDDLRNLQDEREGQRDQFFGNIKEEQMLEQARRTFQLQTNKRNQDYILNQIAQDKETRRKNREEELLYKKPHFGPEETAQVVEEMTYGDRLKKHTVFTNLKAQMQHRKESHDMNTACERQCDRENLDRFMQTQNAEMQAQRDKISNEKRKLKKAWEKQAAMRNDNETNDNIFK